MSISERVKNIRKYYKLSQVDFSKALFIKQASLSQIENGIIAPSLDIVRNIIGKFNISYDWLIEGDGEMLKKDNDRTERAPPEIKCSNCAILEEKIKEKEQTINDLRDSIKTKDEFIEMLKQKASNLSIVR